MRKIFYFFSVMLSMIVGTTVTQAAVVDNYTYDFETAYGVTDASGRYSEHDAAPDGWAHITDSYETWQGDVFPTYSYYATAGLNDSGCLLVSTTQHPYSTYEYQYIDIYDLLVTPKITGSASFYVKLWSSQGSIYAYKITENGNKLEKGDEITLDAEPTTGDWTKITISNLNGERIGLRLSFAYMDDFAADKADIVYSPKLTISGKTNMSPYHDVDDDGNYTLSWKVVLNNVGKVDIADGEYSLYLTQGKDTIDSYPIPALAAGEVSDTILVNHNINIKDYSDGAYVFHIYEGASGSDYSPASVTLTPAKSILGVSYGYTRLDNTGTIAFGTRPNSFSYPLRVSNDGGRALNVTSLTIPSGYTLDKTAPLSVAAHDVDTITIKMDTTVVGVKTGQFQINASDTVFVLNLYGANVPVDQFYENFDDNKIPTTFVPGKWTTYNYPGYARLAGNEYALKSGAADSKLITPKLEFAEGDKLYFDAASQSQYGSSDPTGDLKVYYSADRKNWTQADEISYDATDDTKKLSRDLTVSRTYYQPKSFSVSIPAGQYYIGFAGDNVYLDNIAGGKALETTHDLFVSSSNIPASATVNKTINVSASVQNLGVDEPAGSYKALFYINNEVVDTASSVAINAGATNNYSFKYTPHATGSFPAYIELKGDNFDITSDTVQIEVGEETAESVVRVGTPSFDYYGDIETTNYLPVSGTYSMSQSEIILRASDLGFGAGTEITKIDFPGTSEGATKFNVTAKIANTTESQAKYNSSEYEYEFSDTTSWRTIYNGEYDFAQASDTTNVLSITLDKPFVYDGTNLHLFFDNVRLDDGAQIDFQQDGSKIPALYRRHSNGTTWGSYDEPYQTSAPIVYLTISQTPKTLTGTVTSKTSKEAVAGATVKLTSGDVVYSTTTDKDGKYSLTVYQFDKTYDFSIEAAGYMPYQKAGVKFSEDSENIDVVLPDAKGFYISSSNIPTAATVNHEITATATVKNVEASVIAASAYTATLFIGNDSVQAQTKDVAAGESADFTFNYTPHADGTVKAYISFNAKDIAEIATDTVNVVIAPESFGGIYQVGDSTDLSSSQRSPVNFYYDSSISETIFPAEKIDIPAGANVTRVYFKGYSTGSSSSTSKIRVYIANTTDPVFADNGSYGASTRSDAMADTTAMTKVFDGTYTVSGGLGSEKDNVIVFDVPFSEPFKYEGNNIRLIVLKESSEYTAVYIVSDKDYPTASYMQYDDVSSLADLEGKGWYQRYLPVAYFEAENKTTLSGVVTDADNQPVADATVTLTAGNVVYSGTTDENGNFSIVVAQADKDYTLTASADGFKPYTATETVSLAGGDAEQNITLEKDPNGIISINGNSAEGQKVVRRYNVNGQKVSASQKGVQIVRFADGTTRKIIVK